jgi:hypothetical protein
MSGLDSQVKSLETGVKKAKVAIGRAQVAADKYKVTQAHWDKIDRADAGVQKTLTMMDKIFPEHARGVGEKFGSMLGMLTALAALFLIGSTAALWFFTREKPVKPKRRPKPEEYEDDDEYEYVDE